MNESTPFPVEPERYEWFEPPPYHFAPDRREFFRIAGAGLVVLLILEESRAQEPGGRQRRGFRGGPTAPEIGAWVHILPSEAADSRLAALKTKIDDTYFCWYGPTTDGSAAYYRIQGPSLLIEYAPQGGTNHIHTIIRDPSNDYGKELVKAE